MGHVWWVPGAPCLSGGCARAVTHAVVRRDDGGRYPTQPRCLEHARHDAFSFSSASGYRDSWHVVPVEDLESWIEVHRILSS